MSECLYFANISYWVRKIQGETWKEVWCWTHEGMVAMGAPGHSRTCLRGCVWESKRGRWCIPGHGQGKNGVHCVSGHSATGMAVLHEGRACVLVRQPGKGCFILTPGLLPLSEPSTSHEPNHLTEAF